jgi:hypothetical protein
MLNIALTPEWLLLAAAMFALGLFGLLAAPFIWAFLPFIAMAAISITQALRGATEARFLLRARDLKPRDRVRAFGLIFFMHLMQPAARLWGRLKHGLTPWRRRTKCLPASTSSRTTTIWSEIWRAPREWLADLQEELTHTGAIAAPGGDFDEWDLRVRGGLLAGAKLVMAVEDHAGGKQNVRFRTSFNASRLLPLLGVVAAACVVSGALAGSWLVAGIFTALGAGLAWMAQSDWRSASGDAATALAALQARSPFFCGHAAPHEANAETDQPDSIVAAE